MPPAVSGFLEALKAKAPPGELFVAFLEEYSIQKAGPGAPARFVRELLGAEPSDEQLQLLTWYGEGEQYMAAKSGHGVGKTACLAWIILHHLFTRYPQRTAVTAPTTGQLFDALYPEIKLWLKKLPVFLQDRFEVKGESIVLKADTAGSFLTAKTSRPETPEALAGIHSEYVLLVGDEASGIPDPVFQAASGSMSGHNAITLLAGNPVRTTGLFFDVFHTLKEQWKTITINCENSPRVSKSYCAQMAKRYGANSNAYRVRVLGEFPVAGLRNIIPWELTNAATTRDMAVNPVHAVVWGLDVARYGGDRSALCKRRGTVVAEAVQTWHDLDTMQLAAVIKAEWDRTYPPDRPAEILVDSIGIGAGVVDRLVQLNMPAFGINVSESAAMSDMYQNLKAELWFLAKDWFTKLNCRLPLETNLPEGERSLAEELAIPEYHFTKTSNKFIVESKAEVKKRGFDSPDKADAFVLTFASQHVILSGEKNDWNEHGAALKRNLKGIV